MNLDFAFHDAAGRLVLAGWHPLAGALALQVEDAGGARWPAAVLARFARADLGSDLGLGVLAVAALPDGVAPAALRDAGEGAQNPAATALTAAPLTAEALSEGAARLIAAGLDETFAALLRALAAGQIGPLAPDTVAALVQRTATSAVPMPAHLPRLAAAVDRALVAPGGTGFASGWVLTADGAPAPLAGLATDGTALVPLAIAADTVERDDLGEYRGRYAPTGTDGFVASFRLPPMPGGAADQGGRGGPLLLLLLARDAAHGPALMTAAPARASSAMTAAALTGAVDRLPPSAARALLTPLTLTPVAISALPAGAETEAETGAADRSGADTATGTTAAGSTLLLIPDTDPAELRDILRWLLADLPRPVQVIPLAEDLPAAAQAALAAALAEAAPGVDLAPACPPAALPALTLRAGAEVIAGTAATLFQMGLPAPAPGRASARLHDPLAALPGAAALGADDLLRLPASLRAPAGLLQAALAGVPHGLMSAEAGLGLAMVALAAAGRLHAQRAGPAQLWPGARSGGAAAALDAAVIDAMGAQ